MRFIGAGQVIYRGLEGDAFGLKSMKSWIPPQLELQALHGMRVRSVDFLLGCRISFGSGSFGDAGVQGEAAKLPQSHISCWDGALAAPLCFPEAEFQEQR